MAVTSVWLNSECYVLAEGPVLDNASTLTFS